MVTDSELMTVEDIRKLAIHLQCRNVGKPSAATLYRRRLNKMLSLFPIIRHW